MWFPGIHDLSYEPPPHEAALPTLLRSGSVAGSLFCTSASSTVIASLHCQWQRRALVIALVIQKPRRTSAARIPCGFYVTRLDHISLPLLPHSRLVTYRPQTRTDRGHRSRRTNADLIQSSVKTLVARQREQERVTSARVVCCERVNRCLRQPLYNYF